MRLFLLGPRGPGWRETTAEKKDKFLEGIGITDAQLRNRAKTCPTIAAMVAATGRLPAGRRVTSLSVLMAYVTEFVRTTKDAVEFGPMFDMMIKAVAYHGSTRAKCLSALRKQFVVIRGNTVSSPYGEGFAMSFPCFLDTANTLRMNQMTKQRRVRYGQNQIPIRLTALNILVRNGVNMYTGSGFCESVWRDDWRDRLIFIALVSGARKIEILRRSAFFRSGEKGWFIQYGLAKRRGATVAHIRKPTLCNIPVDVLQQLVTDLRIYMGFKNVKLSRMSDAQLGNYFGRAISSRVKELFEYVIPNVHETGISLHYMRAIYACVSYTERTTHPHVSLPYWISTVLGHAPDDLTTSLHYTKFSVVPE